MKRHRITFEGVLTEGFQIGIKNVTSLLGAVVLWVLTIWIPYINVGTTIAITTIPIELSKDKIISPLVIFDKKYRQYMGEYFTIIGLMMLSIIPALFFMIIPGIIISIGWSLAILILLDKEVAPGEALIQSNKATMGYKWIIFGVDVVLVIAFWIICYLLGLIFGDTISFLIAYILLIVSMLGCQTVIYRDLTSDPKKDIILEDHENMGDKNEHIEIIDEF